MTAKIFIDGAVGTTGLEIHQRLAQRDEFTLVTLDDAQRKDESARRDALENADIAILCLPDAAAKQAAQWAQGSDTRLIDASSAHRVDPQWTYGFPEIIGADNVAKAKYVSNPGCFPTGFLALMVPLLRAGLVHADFPLSVHALSGYSGGGKALIDRFQTDAQIGARAYGLALDHKHLPEMQQYAGLTQPPIFSPLVVDAYRGMLVEVPLPIGAISRLNTQLNSGANMGANTGANTGANSVGAKANARACHETLSQFYADSKIVSVQPFAQDESEILMRKDPAKFDGLELAVFADTSGEHARLIAKLDNLGKGASGACVQSLNLMAGLPQETGLALIKQA